MTYDHWKTTNPADEEPWPDPVEEGEEGDWQFYSGPFACLEGSIAAVRYLNDSFAGYYWQFGVFPDPATATKWIIKRTWR